MGSFCKSYPLKLPIYAKTQGFTRALAVHKLPMGAIMAGITDKEVRALIAKAQREDRTATQADGMVPGLTVTASRTGVAAWVLRYYVGGKRKEATIGQFPVWGAADAREKAKTMRRAVDEGADVAVQKQADKLAKASLWSVNDLAASYFEKANRELAAHTWKQRKRQYEVYIKPFIGCLPAADVTPANVVHIVAKSAEAGKSIPRSVLIIVTQLFHHAVARAVCPSNPCRDVRESAVVGKAEPPKKRIGLTAIELAVFLPALTGIPRPYELGVRVILLTGVRVGTLTEAKISEFDLDAATWSVPHARRKNRRHTEGPFVIPLPGAAVEWIKELVSFADGSEYLLPVESRRHTDRRNPLSKRTTLGAWLDRMRQKNEAAWRRITPHDLRSTCKSWLSELRVDYETRQRYLDHALGGMDAIYDKADYLDRRRVVAEQWLDFLNQCEAGREQGKIVQLRPAVAA